MEYRLDLLYNKFRDYSHDELSLEHHFPEAVVEPLNTKEVQAVEEQSLFYAPDPGEKTATLGAM